MAEDQIQSMQEAPPRHTSGSLSEKHSTPDDMQPSSTCHLLALPAELLNKIIELVVVEQNSIELRIRWIDITPEFEPTGWKLEPLRPGLARTCKLLDELVSPTYFFSNEFHMHQTRSSTEPAPLERVQLLKRHFGRNVQHLRRFTLHHTTGFGLAHFTWTCHLEMQAYQTPDGAVTCELYYIGDDDSRTHCRQQCCCCNLLDLAPECQLTPTLLKEEALRRRILRRKHVPLYRALWVLMKSKLKKTKKPPAIVLPKRFVPQNLLDVLEAYSRYVRDESSEEFCASCGLLKLGRNFPMGRREGDVSEHACRRLKFEKV